MIGIGCFVDGKFYEHNVSPERWIRSNVPVFIDENLGRQVYLNLKSKGYQKVHDVYSLNYQGANDGALFRCLKENKWVLVTKDIKFSKMAKRYGIPCFLVPSDRNWKSRTTVNEIELFLIKQRDQVINYLRGVQL